ncbi:radical SAM protein [Kitasatospora sp. NPDC127116]|uniref:radical SAM protein n=1 Tax=Kitasatospora sp. NPDC127116 TaxID=3345367 RepID=UPI00363B42FF
MIVQPRVLTILGTYKCTAACKNCCFTSNPYITKRLTLADILSFIEEGARYQDCQLVAFSGGECFLLRDDLVTAVAHATNLGLATRCVTNGYWAKRMEHGRRRLQALKAAGLRQLNISTGDHHQKFVAAETVINAACLSVELDLDETVIAVELQEGQQFTADHLVMDPRIRQLLEQHGDRFQIIESPWMPTDYSQVIKQSQRRMLNRQTLHLRTGCTSILNTGVLTPDKNYGFCCGLTREQIPELNAPWEQGSFDALVCDGSADFLKIWLYVDGPEHILAWAATKDERIQWEDRYAHHCHACLALFKDPLVRGAIQAHYRERIDDVLLRFASELRTKQAIRHNLSP